MTTKTHKVKNKSPIYTKREIYHIKKRFIFKEKLLRII